MTILCHYLGKPYFTADETPNGPRYSNTRMYDFQKIAIFNILYCKGRREEKINLLFNLLENSNSGCVHN